MSENPQADKPEDQGEAKPLDKVLNVANKKPTLFLVGFAVIICLVAAIFMCNGSGSSRTSSPTKRPEKAYDKYLLQVVTEDYVKNYLVSPASAEFPVNRDWSITDSGSTVTLSSYVDAQNSFGALVREHFTAKYKLPDVTLTYLEIGGEVVVDR